jgi:beta-lactamase class A
MKYSSQPGRIESTLSGGASIALRRTFVAVKKFVLASMIALFMGFPGWAAAQSPAAAPAAAITPQAALSRLLSATSVSPEWLAPSFTTQIPPSRLDGYIRQYKATLGTFERVEGNGANNEYVAVFSNGTLPSLIALDEQGRVVELLFRVPQLYSVGAAIANLRALPGSVSYFVSENGRETLGYGQEKPLSVGSSFKLSVLAALDSEIQKGRRHWNDVVLLQNAWKSEPTGILQDWPAGSSLTLDTLASLMISQSDNTATDALIHLLGRAAIAPYVPGDDPLMTTRDMFVLKSKSNSALLDQWRAAPAPQRRELLAQLDRMPLPAADDLDTSPANVDVDWQYTNRDLCTLMAKVESLPLMSINPGIVDPADWERVAYKGGSDWGAISMTSWLVGKDGKTYCMSATWNSPASQVDETTFGLAYGSLVESIRLGKQ